MNIPICTAANTQDLPTIASDGEGGAIITWYDDRDSESTRQDIYAQKVNAAGVTQWKDNGIAICTATGVQDLPAIVSDGAGGAIITWEDRRGDADYDIYAQKVSAAGVAEWTVDGVAICTATNGQDVPTIVSDGAGGAIITWKDLRNGATDIYAQRVNAAGAVLWTANGVAICMATGVQDLPTIVSDGAGGAIITWQDQRSGTNDDIYAQRVNAAGVVQWAANGVAVCTATSDQLLPTVVSDGTGGAIITWEDHRSGSNDDIYAQKVSAAGVVQWTTNGVAICTATSAKNSPTIVSDGAGGGIITWDDLRSSTNYDIYAQKVNAAGVVQWTDNGVAICTATSLQLVPTIISDGAGGAIITWDDLRTGQGYDIYAQKVNAGGDMQWTANGVAICTATRVQALPTIVGDGSGGAIITWEDYRSGTNSDIYAQRVLPNGTLGEVTGVNEERNSVPGAFELEQNFPNPFNPTTVINYALPIGSRVTLNVYNLLAQEVRRLVDEEESAGYKSVTVDASSLPSGVYLYRLTAAPHGNGGGALVETKKFLLLR